MPEKINFFIDLYNRKSIALEFIIPDTILLKNALEGIGEDTANYYEICNTKRFEAVFHEAVTDVPFFYSEDFLGRMERNEIFK